MVSVFELPIQSRFKETETTSCTSMVGSHVRKLLATPCSLEGVHLDQGQSQFEGTTFENPPHRANISFGTQLSSSIARESGKCYSHPRSTWHSRLAISGQFIQSFGLGLESGLRLFWRGEVGKMYKTKIETHHGLIWVPKT